MSALPHRLPRSLSTQLPHNARIRPICHSIIPFRLRAHSTMAETHAPQLRMNNCAIFVCDLQEKFQNAIYEFDKVVLTTQKVLRFSAALSLPIYTTTQNATKLGPTVPALLPYLEPPHVVASTDKTRFSMFVPPLTTTSSLPPSATIVLVGIEAHICITQTALDALRAGHKVYVLADAVSSCNREEVPIALARLRSEGAVVTSSESWMYEVVGDAAAPEFKSLIAAVKESAGDTRAALGALCPVPGSSGGGPRI